MQVPLVSVVVPVCNAERFLEKCLDSILGQTLADLELICVDDGSTDRSGAMLDAYARRDSRIRVIHKPNTGYGHSMNVGFDAARGTYLGIVESDDWVEPDMFERLTAAAELTRADVVKSNFYLYYAGPQERDVFFEVIPPRLSGRVFRPLDDVDRERVDFWNRKPSIWSAVYRADFIRENGIRFHETPGASYQDASFNFKVWACAGRVFCLDRAFLHYRQDNQASSVNASTGKVYCVRDEYEEMERFIAARGGDGALLTRIMNRIRFDSYMWNVDRLKEPVKTEFLLHTAQKFAELRRDGQLDPALFEPARWNFLLRVVRDPKRALRPHPVRNRARASLRRIFCALERRLRSWDCFYMEPDGGRER